MIEMLGGFIVFVLYVIYDVNSVRWQNKLLHMTFFLGSALLAVLTVMQAADVFLKIPKGPRFWCFLALAVAAFLLLTDTLFFELPFEKTYLRTEEKPQVYDRGMYALCRHPGVIWFFFFYLFLGIAFLPSGLLCAGMVYSFFNLVYVVFQDVWTFPKTFSDYRQYQAGTPFLIPNPNSIRRAFRTGK